MLLLLRMHNKSLQIISYFRFFATDKRRLCILFRVLSHPFPEKLMVCGTAANKLKETEPCPRKRSAVRPSAAASRAAATMTADTTASFRASASSPAPTSPAPATRRMKASAEATAGSKHSPKRSRPERRLLCFRQKHLFKNPVPFRRPGCAFFQDSKSRCSL